MENNSIHPDEIEDRVVGIIQSEEFRDRFFELVSEQDSWSTENGTEIVDTLEKEFLTNNTSFPADKVSETEVGELIYTVFRRETFRLYTSGLIAEIEQDLDDPQAFQELFL